MIPLLTIALSLISNVTDLAHMFVADQLDERPAFTFYFENRHEEASFALFDQYGDAQAGRAEGLLALRSLLAHRPREADEPAHGRDRQRRSRSTSASPASTWCRAIAPSRTARRTRSISSAARWTSTCRASRPRSSPTGCGRTSATSASATTRSRSSCTSTRATSTCAGSTPRRTARARTPSTPAACRRRGAAGRRADAGVRPHREAVAQAGRPRRRAARRGAEHPRLDVRPAPVLANGYSAAGTRRRSFFSSADSFVCRIDVEELDGVLEREQAPVVEVRRRVLDAAQREGLDRPLGAPAVEALDLEVVHRVVGEVRLRRVAARRTAPCRRTASRRAAPPASPAPGSGG